MNHHPDHDAAVEARLRELGNRPVDPDLRAAHLRRAAAVPTAATKRRFGPVAVGVAAIVGFLAGSAGLASAGALPDPVQNAAHDVLAVVRVEVPEGGNRGACVSEAAKLHDKEAKQAAKDTCPTGRDTDDDTTPDDDGTAGTDAPVKSNDAPGMSGDVPGWSGDAPGRSGDVPGRSGDAPGRSGDAPGQIKHDDDPCRGKPAWAGKMSTEERAALQEAFDRSECAGDDKPDDVDDDNGDS